MMARWAEMPTMVSVVSGILLIVGERARKGGSREDCTAGFVAASQQGRHRREVGGIWVKGSAYKAQIKKSDPVSCALVIYPQV
ncbi:hypothetical protein U128_04525 [Anaplasma marginale str. Gypsy Plains]|uniref:Uncharacterized protein n=1 Tax=Anaplasma marginale (strain Florida) TaxID=320483 RepID=B9KGZ9_ANAMF|nr:Hypothetical protein AMF_877 [Anaplasma marginale str. Florida]AGZ79175.1 hypothetical protein U128_04525 [Anaplasma marginale str. Gypsy Plains]